MSRNDVKALNEAYQASKKPSVLTESPGSVAHKLAVLFPEIHGIKPGKDWGAGKSSIHLGDAAEGGMVNSGLAAADYDAGFHDPKEEFYVMGVHKELEAALEKLGYRPEWHDAGTLLAYPI